MTGLEVFALYAGLLAAVLWLCRRSAVAERSAMLGTVARLASRDGGESRTGPTPDDVPAGPGEWPTDALEGFDVDAEREAERERTAAAVDEWLWRTRHRGEDYYSGS